MAGMSASVKTRRLVPRWSKRCGDYVTGLAWAPGGGQLAAGTGGGGLEIFSAEGEKVGDQKAHLLGVEGVVWTEAGIFTGGQDGRVCRWGGSGEPRGEVVARAGAWVQRLAWGGGYLAVAAGRKVILWSEAGGVGREIEDSAHAFQDLCWEPGGRRLLTAGYGGLRLWDAEEGVEVRSYAWPAALWSCAWSPDGRWVAGGSQEQAVHIWDARSGAHMHMPGYAGKVRLLGWSADSRWLGTAGGADVILWDCSGAGPEGREGKLCAAHGATVVVLAFAPQAAHVATGCAGGRLILWNAEGEDEVVAAAVFEEPLTALAWSADGMRLAVGTGRGAVAVF